jgi:hypothetical protein
MSIQNVLDGICAYFGGIYDPIQRLYTTSPVPGVGVVGRSWPKRDDHAEFFNNMPPGTRTGSRITVFIPRQSEFRESFGGEHGGMKRVLYRVQLCCYLRSRTRHAEDAQDDMYALRDALVEHLRLDRTLGGAVFQAGEAIEGMGAAAGVAFEYGQPETKAELTKGFLLMTFGVVEFVFA